MGDNDSLSFSLAGGQVRLKQSTITTHGAVEKILSHSPLLPCSVPFIHANRPSVCGGVAARRTGVRHGAAIRIPRLRWYGRLISQPIAGRSEAPSLMRRPALTEREGEEGARGTQKREGSRKEREGGSGAANLLKLLSKGDDVFSM